MYKDPVTDHGKMSRKGRMTLELDINGQYITRTEDTGDPQKVLYVHVSIHVYMPGKHLEVGKSDEYLIDSNVCRELFRSTHGVVLEYTHVHVHLHVHVYTCTCIYPYNIP